MLWCSPGELISRPRTLREHRIARSVAPEDVAHAVGMDLRAYLKAEESGVWRGNERQSAALARILRLALPGFVAVTGREAKLAELLRSAVTTRWQAYVRPLLKLVPLDKDVLEPVLQELHQDYQGTWPPPSAGAAAAGAPANRGSGSWTPSWRRSGGP